MEQIFNGIEATTFMMRWGLLVALVTGALFALSMNLVEKSKSDWSILWFFGALGTFFITAISIIWSVGSNLADSGSLRSLVENESVSCPMIVVEKKSNVEYDYYRLECGRIKDIYARVPKFMELSSERYYVLRLRKRECITPGVYIGHCVDQAIAKYELYKDK